MTGKPTVKITLTPEQQKQIRVAGASQPSRRDGRRSSAASPSLALGRGWTVHRAGALHSGSNPGESFSFLFFRRGCYETVVIRRRHTMPSMLAGLMALNRTEHDISSATHPSSKED